MSLNVQNEESAARAFDQHDVVLNCASYRLNVSVMRAALRARVPYIDLGGLYHVTLDQLALHEDFAQAGLTALLGMGSAPGITNVMAGALAAQMDRVEEVHVRVACQDEARAGSLPTLIPWKRSSTSFLRRKSFEWAGGHGAPAERFRSSRISSASRHGRSLYTLHSEVAMFPTHFRN